VKHNPAFDPSTDAEHFPLPAEESKATRLLNFLCSAFRQNNF
jgi:hypothetical protein